MKLISNCAHHVTQMFALNIPVNVSQYITFYQRHKLDILMVLIS